MEREYERNRFWFAPVRVVENKAKKGDAIMDNEVKKELDQDLAVEAVQKDLETIEDAELTSIAAGVPHSIQPCL